MMGADNQVVQATQVKCGACKEANHSDAKFCKGCGQSLHEPCVDCGRDVLLTQKFCGSCGADLEQAFQLRHARYEKCLADAVESTKRNDFDRAVSLLGSVAEVSDYRFQALAKSASAAVEKVQGLRARAEQNRDDTMAKANTAIKQGDKASVIQLLESIPAALISDEATKLLSRLKSHFSERTALEDELKEAISAKDWPRLGGLIEQLIDLVPEDQQYVRLGKQVSEKLMASATRALAKGDYALALRKLSSVPNIGQTSEYQKLLTSVGDAHWLADQFSSEPFATPLLGRLAVRFAKAAPRDTRAKELVGSIAKQLKQGERTPRNPYPLWQGTTNSWPGGNVAVLGVPQSIDVGEHKLLSTLAGRFNIAYGLALQGLGRGRVTEHFGPKQGLLGALRKKKSRCWGVDIGSSTFKAVLLEESEGQLSVVDCFFQEFPQPLCRMGDATDNGSSTITPIVETFIESKEVEGTPLWINLPDSLSVNRYVRLPPVKDKQANILVDQEIEQKIPIPTDELSVVRWIAKAEEDSVHGRATLITVVRRRHVEGRVQMLTDAGLAISGVQTNAIALVNFATTEFDELAMDDDSDAKSNSEESAHTLCFLDCGASATTLTLVSDEAHWSWTIESGGEDITAMVARATKMTRSDAETLKRNPAEIESPSKQYEQAEQKLVEIRARLETALADARKQNGRFRVEATWCFGGGCMAHEWIRLVTLESEKS
ncbi:MAG: pilus assembly protein PilM [Rubripirellula sp.]